MVSFPVKSSAFIPLLFNPADFTSAAQTPAQAQAQAQVQTQDSVCDPIRSTRTNWRQQIREPCTDNVGGQMLVASGKAGWHGNSTMATSDGKSDGGGGCIGECRVVLQLLPQEESRGIGGEGRLVVSAGCDHHVFRTESVGTKAQIHWCI